MFMQLVVEPQKNETIIDRISRTKTKIDNYNQGY